MAGNHFNGRKSNRLSDAIRLNGETSSNENTSGDTKLNDNEISEPPTTVNASASVSWFSAAMEMGDPEEDFQGFGSLDKEEEDFLIAPVSMLSITDDFIDSRRFLKHFDSSNYKNDESEGDEDDQENKIVDATDNRPSSRTSDDDSGGANQGLINKDTPINEALLKPFSVGWKREFVCRAVPDPKISRNQGEVYYHTPNGKKLRSSKEVKPYLSDGLTLENFTFSKISLGTNDPDKEIIREAKLVNKRSSALGITDVAVSNILGKRQPKQKFPKGASPPPEKLIVKSATKPVRSKSTNLRPVILATGASTKKIENRKSSAGLHKPGITKYDKGTLEMGMLPPWGDSSGVKRPAAKSNKNKDDSVSNVIDSSMSPVHTPRRKLMKNASNKTSQSIQHQTQESAVQEPMEVVDHTPQTGPVTLDEISEPLLEQTDPRLRQTIYQQPFPPGWFFFADVAAGFLALKKIFKYLKVQDLLRCSRVSVMFHDIAMSPALWREVKLKNSQVVDATKMCQTLTQLRSLYLDMRKTLPPPDMERFWNDFSANIGFVTTLEKLDLCRCSAETVHKIFSSNPNLEYLNAGAISSDSMSLDGIGSMKYLREVRFKSLNGFVLNSSLQPLEELRSTLRDLSLTSVRQLGHKDVEVIGRLTKLVRLEIGECCELPEKFGTEILTKLPILRRLRFEKGQGDCPTDDLLTGVSMMPTVTCLELVNFDIKPGFDKSLTVIKDVKKLLIIPTYISQSATTNKMVLAGVITLKNLTSFSWGVTHELLRVTDLFVDQIAKNEKNDQNPEAPGPSIPQQPIPGENIPILKPVPGRIPPAEPKDVNPQVEILPLPELQAILNYHLPNSKVIILKMPFSGSWRQFISD